MLKLDRSSTQAVSVKNYEIRLFRSDYTHIPMYLCRVSFFTTLDIYKDYFKGRHKVMQEQYMHCVIESRNSSSSSFSLKKLLRLYAKGFVTNELSDFHC